MGEIIVSIAIGGCLVIAGVIMIVVLGKEEKTFAKKDGDAK